LFIFDQVFQEDEKINIGVVQRIAITQFCEILQYINFLL